MYLTITADGSPTQPATDLGYLLHKHPEKVQDFSTSYGTARVFYPEATPRRCTAAMLLEVDPVALARRARRGNSGPDASLSQYVNDRPYAASSLLAVALGSVFRSALRGTCAARPELPGREMELRIEVPALSARGGGLVRRLFEPLGWRVRAEAVPLDERFPEWGEARCLRLSLEGTATLAAALRQLYVLLPVLDGAKHYWVSQDEVDKLLRAGEGWLEHHPEQALITARYLAYRRGLAREAMERLELVRLAEADDTTVGELDNAVPPTPETPEAPEPETTGTTGTGDTAAPVSLSAHRRAAILAALGDSGAARVLDLGCGEGRLLADLVADRRFSEIVGVDVSTRALRIAARRLRLDRMGERQAARVNLFQSSLSYVDSRLAGYDAAVLSEVVEHVDPARLRTLEHGVFAAARPRTAIVTTPNVEYNVRWESLPAGEHRHHDHRFEWTRAEFRRWAEDVAARHGYTVALRPVGEEDPEVGPPTQLALFTATGPEEPADRGRIDARRKETAA
ncbi:3' terminal RNA ribose 2'-O-methyltransferase Hen1 [Streptomyces alkaliterrae]|uniref:Small RNA 2'-O-methyltransferase n=1 Tax=Streptomyces alkaliterrae TaxID=2213162 RepID=A0A5P0YN21_9ACTN|nr:3' terminal RNA ribose 2'-O-methyltransferase Hen1 [Streptomyces alkaliterrae]MBB1259145.1 3' terminal RNA ribose 2'-O-methyltransferase Hen1 [Streptomyces alkaliterrae]MQS01696.1 3' terminal RNA ribose 2'-O-methyltransferase Hen1 [Streptomyces alkaliterrae]